MSYKYVPRNWLITLRVDQVKGKKPQSQDLVFTHVIHIMSH
jgi:hypothetical protein